MKKTLTILVALLIIGLASYMIRKNMQQARNKKAIQRIFSNDRSRPGSNARQDVRQRERVNKTRAGARHRQSQQ